MFCQVKALSRSSRTDKYAAIMVVNNRYQVPSSYAGVTLRSVLTVDRVQIYKQGEQTTRQSRGRVRQQQMES